MMGGEGYSVIIMSGLSSVINDRRWVSIMSGLSSPALGFNNDGRLGVHEF